MTTQLQARSRQLQSVKRRGDILKGCLIVLLILVILGVIGGVFVYMNYRGWLASGMRAVVTEVVQESDLPDADKQGILGEVNDLMDKYEAGDVSLGQLGEVVTTIAEGPVIAVGVVSTFNQNYINESALEDAEKADAALTMQRLARGVYEEKISLRSLDDLAEPISEPDPDADPNQPQLNLKNPEEVTVDELRAFIANVKARVDEEEIPNEPFEVDIVEEVRKSIDSALGGGGSHDHDGDEGHDHEHGEGGDHDHDHDHAEDHDGETGGG